MVENYIKTILFKRKQVVIIGFGELVYAHRSAWTSPESDGSVKLHPPGEELIFNNDENIAVDNGLCEQIARNEHLSVADAKRIISEYVKHVRSHLEKEEYSLDGIGVFFLKDGDVSFRPDAPEDYTALHEAILYPIKRDDREEASASSAHMLHPSSGRTVLVSGFSVLIFLALAVVYGIFVKKEGFNLIEAFQGTPSDTLQVREKNTQRLSYDSLQDDSMALRPGPTGLLDTISEKTGRFYLIAGTFKTIKGAEDLLVKVQAKEPSVKPSLILPAPKYPKFKVAVWSGNTKEEAAEAYERLSIMFGKDIWVFEY